ncbi:TPA: DUF1266 domain-containing protein [Salmonella enterica subsp. salamae serovar 16:m,t:e,n,x]|uniref:DUF1266 domain-containing protein n=1 Tax=Salmonella enterica subsp. salamae TaxID=59202 RepID=A0A5Y3XC52_SALER|nr:DUF1266 domain-containing protein [Salmonella enterica]EAB6840932.1 DUF1266 domain-containing protein [Salmonella enterica subsp. salamae]ECF6029762.1 DUF1266 domain-containing protein [Salmonella enterica subsp. salamae serovar Greenside]EDT2642209.1 DUF1266 domain-containing protein [Salmonella enterica subsp. enterica serovar Abony]HCM1922894.1 DUF1266 domain-containing protein [Salmonella enterica subsp. salamae serovar 16:m,t:e,n,x]ECJ4506588.1 DUF1266 domain-containing protein [Salmon
MDKKSQYLLFALSAPMEVLNECSLPSHSSPGMYSGIKRFDLESSWGIEKRDELLQTLNRMTDGGHATDLDGLYCRWFCFAPQEWQEYVDALNERGRIYARLVAETAMCCGEGGIRAWDYVRMGFLCRTGVLNQWLTEEESLWLQSRIQRRALYYYSGWLQYFTAYSVGRLYWQSSYGDNLPLLQETLARKEFDEAGRRMVSQLIAEKASFYATLPWCYLPHYPECPDTLKDVSDL